MTTEREKVEKELRSYFFNDGYDKLVHIDDLVDWVIQDRRRICEPIFKLGDISRGSKIWNRGGISVETFCQVSEEVLTRAGLDKEDK